MQSKAPGVLPSFIHPCKGTTSFECLTLAANCIVLYRPRAWGPDEVYH